MNGNGVDKFINSSISLAFLTVTSLASAYCYSWGVAIFHGLPWWHVEIGNSTVARSLVWVLGSSFILFGGYLLGYLSLRGLSRSNNCMGYWRVLVLVSVFSFPVVLTFYCFIGRIPLYVGWTYLSVLVVCMLLFHKKWSTTALQLDIRKLFVGNRWWFGIVFIFLYFSLLSLVIGYLRSDWRETYDVIEIQGKQYHILLINGERDYILGEHTQGNVEFVFFNRERRDFYKISILKKRS